MNRWNGNLTPASRTKSGIRLFSAFAAAGMRLCAELAVNDPLTTGEFKWVSTAPLLAPVERANDPCLSVKDPSIVYHEGRWHLFCTIHSQKRTHQIEYVSFDDWNHADTAPRHLLNVSPAAAVAPARPGSTAPPPQPWSRVEPEAKRCDRCQPEEDSRPI